MHDPSHGVHDERKERVEGEEGSYRKVEQRPAANVVRQPVVANHEQRRRRQHRVNLSRQRVEIRKGEDGGGGRGEGGWVGGWVGGGCMYVCCVCVQRAPPYLSLHAQPFRKADIGDHRLPVLYRCDRVPLVTWTKRDSNTFENRTTRQYDSAAVVSYE